MDNSILNINKEYISKEIDNKLNLFCDAIRTKNNVIDQLHNRIHNLENNKTILARAYAKEIGVLI